jgi:Asp-tRNA(Asn)/Glu-tRNA(Gln) amidotransferase A subunit family amidase
MPLYDYGRAAISKGLPDGPFTGVPFLMKDVSAAIAGVPMTRSSRFFADAPAPAADSEHVARLKRAGLVIFGRTNTCELGLSLTCEPRLHGPTRNPWDLTRISGGSSGGAAAAVGARMLPMAHATDGFGSIRAPAACCGLVGLKPRAGAHDGAGARRGARRLLDRARGDLVGARLRGAPRRDERPGRRRSRRAAAGPALPAGSRHRSGRAPSPHEPRAERREDRAESLRVLAEAAKPARISAIGSRKPIRPSNGPRSSRRSHARGRRTRS